LLFIVIFEQSHADGRSGKAGLRKKMLAYCLVSFGNEDSLLNWVGDGEKFVHVHIDYFNV